MSFYFAVDVHYFNKSAIAAGLLFADHRSQEVYRELVKEIDDVLAYESGAFYKRELPCILALLKDVPETINAIIVDGFVTLGAELNPGLGMYLYEALDEKTPVIGVAKNGFIGTPESQKIYRGNSEKPLYVSSVGLNQDEAHSLVLEMHGDYRIPTILRKVDHLCRGLV